MPQPMLLAWLGGACRWSQWLLGGGGLLSVEGALVGQGPASSCPPGPCAQRWSQSVPLGEAEPLAENLCPGGWGAVGLAL